jgi:hypothetical protein
MLDLYLRVRLILFRAEITLTDPNYSIVGHETTAGVLSFTLHALAQNQQVQSTLREELRSYGGSLGYDDLNSGLPYLDACVKEGYNGIDILPLQ